MPLRRYCSVCWKMVGSTFRAKVESWCALRYQRESSVVNLGLPSVRELGLVMKWRWLTCSVNVWLGLGCGVAG
jgi:hypothetical protein